MEKKLEHCRIQNWYPRLSVYSLPTNFVFLMDIEIQALQNGDTESGIAKGVIDRLTSAMSKFPFTRFVGTDLVAPTDTVRFEEKRGAVRSATSAWYFLTQSAKVRNAAQNGAVSAPGGPGYRVRARGLPPSPNDGRQPSGAGRQDSACVRCRGIRRAPVLWR